MGRCDWDHEAEDVRRLPLYPQDSHAAVFVCYMHYRQEIAAGTEPVGRRPAWREWGNLQPQEQDA